MLNLSEQAKSILENNIEEAIFCFEFTLKNERRLYFTSTSCDFTYKSINYLSNTGMKINHIISRDNGYDEVYLECAYDENILSSKEVNAGLLEGALVSVYCLLETELILLKKGDISQIEIYEQMAKFHISDSRLNSNITLNYSRTCRAKFGDEKCRIEIEKYSNVSNIRGIKNNQILIDEIKCSPHLYEGGTLIYRGNQACIKLHEDSIIELLPNELDIQIGEEVTLLPACDKKLDTCINKYKNVLNFRGEPFIPGK